MLKPGRPLHEQVSDWLQAEIERGTYGTDAQLPSESQLGTRFGVSRITVRRALQTLESEGVIYRRQGLGSFVKDNRVRQGLVRLTDFVEDMTQAGLTAASQVLHFGLASAPTTIAEALGLVPGASVFRLDRLRLGDGTPLAFDRTWLPAFYAQFLDGHDLTRETIYHILEHDYQIPVLRGRYRIGATGATAELAGHLGVPEGHPLLRIRRISMTEGDRRIYVQLRYYRSDRVAYDLELERDPGQSPAVRHGLPLHTFEPIFKREEPPA